MYIEKIEVPAFRVLRDVSLEFGAAYSPQVFPIGSENGGGKSTLLQLVFTLLHCSTDGARIPYLRNLLASDCRVVETGDSERLLACLTIRFGEKRYSLEFVSLNASFLAQELDAPPSTGFQTKDELNDSKRASRSLERQISRVEEIAARYSSLPPEQEVRPDPDLVEIFEKRASTLYRRPTTARMIMATISAELTELAETRSALKERLGKLSADAERIDGLLIARNYFYITSYRRSTVDKTSQAALICRIAGLGVGEVTAILQDAAAMTFLLGPSNQQYLFLDKEARRALLGAERRRETVAAAPGRLHKPQRPQIEYLARLNDAENAMAGFYAYDWLSVSPLERLFASARDEDFTTVVKTGTWGSNYTTLLREVNGLLQGKTVRPLANPNGITGVEFVVTDEAGRETALSPEDLSQGELKRLMIYAWLRASSALNAVVLIDEIETSFHPDWQIGIVRDLQDWGASNQYLLATHSYELCQVLTPSHVRELQPRLKGGTEKDTENAD